MTILVNFSNTSLQFAVLTICFKFQMSFLHISSQKSTRTKYVVKSNSSRECSRHNFLSINLSFKSTSTRNSWNIQKREIFEIQTFALVDSLPALALPGLPPYFVVEIIMDSSKVNKNGLILLTKKKQTAWIKSAICPVMSMFIPFLKITNGKKILLHTYFLKRGVKTLLYFFCILIKSTGQHWY